MKTTGTIFDIRRFTLDDGPGIRTTVFLKGCPLRCRWCQNPESLRQIPELFYASKLCRGCRSCEKACAHSAVDFKDGQRIHLPRECVHCGRCVRACPAEALTLSGVEMTLREALAIVERDQPFYESSGGGLTVSGGEPLLQYEFTAALLHAAREAGIHTAVDTSGYAPWEAFEAVLPHTSLVLLDLKLGDEDRHREATGVTNGAILDNARRLGAGATPVTVRFPVIPGLTDDAENVSAIAGIVAELPAVTQIDILPFNRLSQSKYERLGLTHFLSDPSSSRGADTDTIAALLAASGKPTRIVRGLGAD